MQRRIVHFSGRVQGVGFRYTSERIATNFNVAGFVRNLTDGRVELVAEGMPAELDRFLSAIADAMSGNIDSQSVELLEPDGDELTGFKIRY